MEVYKIGNKIKGIIRAYSSGQIGNIVAQYDNQPYTIFEGKTANLTFSGEDVTATYQGNKRAITYNKDRLKEITISDIPLTEKICALIYQANETNLCSTARNYESDDEGKIYLNNQSDIYQVFIYNDEGQLERAEGTLTDRVITVLKPNSSYLIVYSFLGTTGFNFDKPNNLYIGLDLEIEGNVDDDTTTMYIHIEKVGFRINKNLYFSQSSNAVDITFIALADDNNYIVVK